MLEIGIKAPDFEGIDENENLIKLADFLGKKLVVYFYPKDDTPACTAQACSLRDSYALFQQQGYEIVGISTDNAKKHKKFKEKHGLPFTLLADTEHQIADIYGVWQEKTLYGRKYMGIVRTTFVIDGQGIIENIITKIDTKNHAAQLEI